MVDIFNFIYTVFLLLCPLKENASTFPLLCYFLNSFTSPSPPCLFQFVPLFWNLLSQCCCLPAGPPSTKIWSWRPNATERRHPVIPDVFFAVCHKAYMIDKCSEHVGIKKSQITFVHQRLSITPRVQVQWYLRLNQIWKQALDKHYLIVWHSQMKK